MAEESRRIREEEEDAEERARRKRLGLPELEKKSDTPPLKEDEVDIPEEELLAKLQDMDEPRFLFSETHVQRLRRYRKLTEKALAPKLTDGPIPTTLELVLEADMKVPETVPKDPEARKFVLNG